MNLSDLKNKAALELNNEQFEYRDWFLYDTMFSVVSATQILRFFQQNGGTVGRAITNMTGNGQLPAPEIFFATELMFCMFNTTGVPFVMTYTGGAGGGAAVCQYEQILSSMFFDLRIEPSVEFQGHGRMLRDQQNVAIDVAAAAVSGGPTNNLIAKVLKFKTPLTILPNRSFSLDMTVTTPAAGGGYAAATTAFFWGLRGVKRRAK